VTPRVESLELATVRGAVAPLAGAASGQTVRAGLLLRVLDARGAPMSVDARSFDHFA